MKIRIIASLASLSLLAACSSTPEKQPGPLVTDGRALLQKPDPTPKREPPSKTGNPASYVVFGKRYHVLDSSAGFSQRGLASWYGKKFHGRKTSSGARYDMYEITAAHKRLPIPTYVRVTRTDNGRSIVVKVNDRGPFVTGRVIDLSYAAAAKLDMLQEGTVPVEIVALSPYQAKSGAAGKQLAQQQKKQYPLTSDTMAASADQPARNDAAGTALRPLLSETLTRIKPPSQHNSLIVQRGVDSGTFFLQVGAFSKRRGAEQLQQRLSKSLGRPIQINTDGGLYKVRIGPLADHADLAPLSKQIAAMGLEQPRVIY